MALCGPSLKEVLTARRSLPGRGSRLIHCPCPLSRTSFLFRHSSERDGVKSTKWFTFSAPGPLWRLSWPVCCVVGTESTIMNYRIAVKGSLATMAALALAAMMPVALPTAAAASPDAQSESRHPDATPSIPKFEVASIKPAPPLIPGMRSPGLPLGVRTDKAQATFGGMSLAALISYAYGVKLTQISGPDWLATQRFDIVAKLPEGGVTERVPEMMQALLADRFGLKLRRDNKEFSVYALVAAKTGMKLTPKPEDFDPKAHGDQMAIPVLSLTLLLEQSLGVPVVDETELKGQYLFPSEVIRQVMMAGRTASAQQSAASASSGTAEDVEPADLHFTKLLLTAGMKLEKKKARLPVLVVESMLQSPMEN